VDYVRMLATRDEFSTGANRRPCNMWKRSLAIRISPPPSYNFPRDERTLGSDRNHDSIPYRGQDAR
jgi:hypothetical protein